MAEVRVYPTVSASDQGAADLHPDAADSCLGGVEHQDEMADERRMALQDELPPQVHQTQPDACRPAESGAHCPVYWDYLAASLAAVEI